MTHHGPQIEAKRDASGRYSVPEPEREPIDWGAIGFLVLSVFSLVSTVTSLVRWLCGV